MNVRAVPTLCHTHTVLIDEGVCDCLNTRFSSGLVPVIRPGGLDRMLKGHYVVLEKVQTVNFNVYSINEVIICKSDICFFHKCINKLFSEENKGARSPGHHLKLERWQGQPHTNVVQQDEIVLLKPVCLFG